MSSIAPPSITSANNMNRPPVYIRRSDLVASLKAYEKLLSVSKAYTSTMLAMSKASSDLAHTLEECSRVKGAHMCGATFQAASGLHYLKSNYEQVLCDTFWKEFSIPLLSRLDAYKSAVHERQVIHENAVSEKSRLLKEIERRNQRQGKRHERDLSSFRQMLSELQAQVDELDTLKLQHYTDVLESEEQNWEYLASKVALLVRTQVEIADRLSSKATSDPVLDSMSTTVPDPFHSYGPPKREDELFTILQPSGLASSGLAMDSGMDDESGPRPDPAPLLDDGSTPATRLPRLPTFPNGRNAAGSGDSEGQHADAANELAQPGGFTRKVSAARESMPRASQAEQETTPSSSAERAGPSRVRLFSPYPQETEATDAKVSLSSADGHTVPERGKLTSYPSYGSLFGVSVPDTPAHEHASPPGPFDATSDRLRHMLRIDEAEQLSDPSTPRSRAEDAPQDTSQDAEEHAEDSPSGRRIWSSRKRT